MSALDAAAQANDAKWGIIVELFEQTSGPPIDDQTYSARPASIDRLAFQLALAKRFPSAVCSSYSMQEHMLRKAGVQAAALASSYKKRYVDEQDAGPQRSNRPERSAIVR